MGEGPVTKPPGIDVSCAGLCELGPADPEGSCWGWLGSWLSRSIRASEAPLRSSSGKSAAVDWPSWLCEAAGFSFSFCGFSPESLASQWELLAARPRVVHLEASAANTSPLMAFIWMVHQLIPTIAGLVVVWTQPSRGQWVECPVWS